MSPRRSRNRKFIPRRLAKAHPGNLTHCNVQRKWKYETEEAAVAALGAHWGTASKTATRAYVCPCCNTYHVSSEPYMPSRHRCPETHKWKFQNRSEAAAAAREVNRNPADAVRCKTCKQFHFDPELQPITATNRTATEQDTECL